MELIRFILKELCQDITVQQNQATYFKEFGQTQPTSQEYIRLLYASSDPYPDTPVSRSYFISGRCKQFEELPVSSAFGRPRERHEQPSSVHAHSGSSQRCGAAEEEALSHVQEGLPAHLQLPIFSGAAAGVLLQTVPGGHAHAVPQRCICHLLLEAHFCFKSFSLRPTPRSQIPTNLLVLDKFLN